MGGGGGGAGGGHGFLQILSVDLFFWFLDFLTFPNHCFMEQNHMFLSKTMLLLSKTITLSSNPNVRLSSYLGFPAQCMNSVSQLAADVHRLLRRVYMHVESGLKQELGAGPGST